IDRPLGCSAEDAIKEWARLSNAASSKIRRIFIIGFLRFNCRTLLFEKYSIRAFVRYVGSAFIGLIAIQCGNLPTVTLALTVLLLGFRISPQASHTGKNGTRKDMQHII